MSGLVFQKFIEAGHGGKIAPLLSVRNLSVSVGMRLVLDKVNLEVFPGEHVRITGPNGSGKSTLLNAIAGVDPARIEAGTIKFAGYDLKGQSAHVRSAKGIAYMLQSENLFSSLTVAENLRIALGQDGTDIFAKSFPDWKGDLPLSKHAGLLSGGQKKKLAWAMTVLRPDWNLLLLDEPRAGVQAGSLDCTFSLDGRCILEIEHNHEDAP
jgi:ABC-type branched-subunit amino acid transport system ATPase component